MDIIISLKCMILVSISACEGHESIHYSFLSNIFA